MTLPDARTQPNGIGTIYGVLLNDRATQARMAAQFNEPPYKAPPRAPVLYIKPRNTHASDGAVVPIPAAPGTVRVDATIGLLIGSTAWRVSEQTAMSHVSGFVIASDLTLPHDNYYRPAIRQRCRDQFCPISKVFSGQHGFDVNSATLALTIRDAAGQTTQTYQRSFAHLVRSAAVLLADVTEFMTLSAGDVLMLGPGDGSPLAHAGDSIHIHVPGLGALQHTLTSEAGVHA